MEKQKFEEKFIRYFADGLYEFANEFIHQHAPNDLAAEHRTRLSVQLYAAQKQFDRAIELCQTLPKVDRALELGRLHWLRQEYPKVAETFLNAFGQNFFAWPPLALSLAVPSLGYLNQFSIASNLGLYGLLSQYRQLYHRQTPKFPAYVPISRNRQTNIIAFGVDERRLMYEGALANVFRAAIAYPDWTCRFYCRPTVPAAMRRALRAAGAQVMDVPPSHDYLPIELTNTAVIDAPDVAYFMLRSAFALIGSREIYCTEEWLASGKFFHTIRDAGEHTCLLIANNFAGYAPAMRTIAPHITLELKDWFTDSSGHNALFTKALWPKVRHSLCMHDDWFSLPGNRRMPEVNQISDEQYIGHRSVIHPLVTDHNDFTIYEPYTSTST